MLNLFTTTQDGCRFTDSYNRVWIKQSDYGHSFLVGITKDTPTFTEHQLIGLAIDGFCVLPSEQTEMTADAKEEHQNKRGIASRFLRRKGY